MARRFFESEFRAFRVLHEGADGLLTGYFEPELAGSLVRDNRFTAPVLRRPADLVDTVPVALRAKAGAEGKLTAMRESGGKLLPYYTRAEIDAGALSGRGLELVYLDSAIDAYFMHVQGSGRIRLPDGRVLSIGFAGKNGYPYTSIGSVLVARGLAKPGELTMPVLRAWLEQNPTEAKALMEENKSYIFFEQKPGNGDDGPIGARGSPLSARRSLAVDASFYVLGLPIFVTSRTIRDEHGAGFHHLMIAEDVGSAIKGPERGDIFWGTGKAAEAVAGLTNDRGNFIVLLPRVVAESIKAKGGLVPDGSPASSGEAQ
jgi:membrane-bound lytic murein transglycosylase A